MSKINYLIRVQSDKRADWETYRLPSFQTEEGLAGKSFMVSRQVLW